MVFSSLNCSVITFGQFYSFFYFIVLVLVCIEDDYFNKMSDEVDMDMDDTVKNEDCSKIFTTMKVIISSL